jgi:uncharacterized protein DUF6232
MPGLLAGDRERRSGPFGQLTIERRVLLTPGSTIPVAGVTAVSVGLMRPVRKLALGLGLAVLVAAVILLAGGYQQNSVLMLGLGGASLLGGFMLVGLLARGEQACLSIATAGGQVFLFTGQRKILEEARRVLTDKINTGDESAVFRINFEKGIVHAVGQPEPIGEPLSGPTSLTVAGNTRIGAPEPRLQPTGAPELQLKAIGAPGRQVANGHYPGVSAHIDYASVLPQIVDMQRFYAQRQDTQDIAERLNELEYLMRSGTPTPAGRSRLGQLVAELSAILGAYPNVVQIFQQAARLAGM